MTEHRGAILVVDDEPDMVKGMRRILRLDGYHIDSEVNVSGLLSRTNLSEYFAIILDRKLPDGSADELLPKLRELAPDTAVVIVTGYADMDGALAALRHGAADYLIKPVNPDALRASLARIVHVRLAETRALQAERLAAIGEAMAGLVHESRNALSRTQSALRMIERRTKDKPELDEFFDGAREAQQDIQHLFEEVRQYAAPVNIVPKPCNLVELIDRTWKHLRLVRKKRTARLSHSCEGVTPECDACHTTLSQVFRNILENALAACEDPVEIEVHYSNAELHGEPAIRVAVCDNGSGLTPEIRAHVFDAFHTTRTRGTGLGMAIAKRIVEAHGGSIGVGDGNGCGAEFVVSLPLRKS